MKTKLFLCTGLFILSTQLVFSQWTQMGGDIDGEAIIDISGYSVSLSNDGNIMAIGSSYGNVNDSGHVRIFQFDGSNWNQIGSTINGEANVDLFGSSVSLSGNGNRLAVGAPRNDGGGIDAGHVRTYEFDGLSWNQVGSDIDGESSFDRSGSSVSLSNDGNHLAIGAPENDDGGGLSGHVRIFQFDGSNWNQVGGDIDGESVSDRSGSSVSINGNGSRVAIGAAENDGNGANSGHVRVYEFDGLNWNQIGVDIDGEAAEDESGTSVNLNYNGDRLAVGAPFNDGNGASSGHTRIYEFDGANWNQLGSDIDGEAAGDLSGHAVTFNNDGSRLAVGAIENDDSGNRAGHVRVYDFDGGSWIQTGDDIDGESIDDFSGTSLSMSSDGNLLAIGGPYNDGDTGMNSDNRGHVRVYSYLNLAVNTALGEGSGMNTTTGTGNVFLGDYSGFNITEGSDNTFIGNQSGFNTATGSGNVFLGYRTGYSETGSNLLYIDNSSTTSPLIWGDFENDLLQFNSSVAIANIVQDDALTRVLVADDNGNISWRSDTTLGGGGDTFPSYPESAGDGGDVTNAYFGHESGLISTGGNNTFIGHQSGYSNTIGYENSGLGSLTLHDNTAGARNTANGIYSLYANLTGNENTGVGFAALGFNTTGLGNTANGVQSLVNNIEGDYNTAIGHQALSVNTIGDGNVAIGYSAGPAAGNTALQNSVAIGYQASVAGNNATAIGNGAVVNAANEVRIGNASVTSIGGAVAWSVVSDGRFKKAIREDVPGLEFIGKLRPVSYELDQSKLQTFLKGADSNADTPATSKTPSRTIGFVAQEVATLLEENEYTFSGVERPENKQDHYSIRYAEFVVPLTKAVQELNALVEAQEQRIKALEALLSQANTNVSGIRNTDGNKENGIQGVVLHQNIPNPFHKTTVISAEVPKGVQEAIIIIYNLQGLELERFAVAERERVSVEISGGSLPSGMYLYALIADGQLIDTKKMILTR